MAKTYSPVIYVIDDDEGVRKSLARLLRIMDFSVQCFASAREFLKKYSHDAKGCLILDVRMPGMDGLELQKKLIERKLNIPIIFITAHDDPLACHRGLNAGAVAFLHKPLDEQELIMAISKATGIKFNDLCE
jgi:FixJ family two-component response regulator